MIIRGDIDKDKDIEEILRIFTFVMTNEENVFSLRRRQLSGSATTIGHTFPEKSNNISIIIIFQIRTSASLLALEQIKITN